MQFPALASLLFQYCLKLFQHPFISPFWFSIPKGHYITVEISTHPLEQKPTRITNIILQILYYLPEPKLHKAYLISYPSAS